MSVPPGLRTDQQARLVSGLEMVSYIALRGLWSFPEVERRMDETTEGREE